jgi:hypothetical protein
MGQKRLPSLKGRTALSKLSNLLSLSYQFGIENYFKCISAATSTQVVVALALCRALIFPRFFNSIRT